MGFQPAGNEVHRWRADEAGDEPGARRVVQVVRRADLLDDAVVHDHNPVGQRHGLDLVVGNVDRRHWHFLVHPLDLSAHLHAQLRVEVRQRLVEEEDLRVAHDGAAHGDALPLAPGQLLRLAVEQFGYVQDAGGLIDPALDLVLREALQAQPERHVLVHRHMRVERVVLEHHRDVAVLRRHVVDDGVANQDVAAADLLQAGDHAERRGLAAAGRADQDDEFLVGDFEIDAAHGLDFIVALDHLAQRHLGHRVLRSLFDLVAGRRTSAPGFLFLSGASPSWLRRSGRRCSSPSGRRR